VNLLTLFCKLDLFSATKQILFTLIKRSSLQKGRVNLCQKVYKTFSSSKDILDYFLSASFSGKTIIFELDQELVDEGREDLLKGKYQYG
jgi:hypothetical protein